MTQPLISMGASLMDVANISKTGKLLNQNPFQDEMYNGGGNTKASDGLVLGEHVAVALGADITNIQFFDVLFNAKPIKADVHNYAHAGAESGIGLRKQVKLIKENQDYYKGIKEVDVIISCGEKTSSMH